LTLLSLRLGLVEVEDAMTITYSPPPAESNA
jgi:hypothetical protein